MVLDERAGRGIEEVVERERGLDYERVESEKKRVLRNGCLLGLGVGVGGRMGWRRWNMGPGPRAEESTGNANAICSTSRAGSSVAAGLSNQEELCAAGMADVWNRLFCWLVPSGGLPPSHARFWLICSASPCFFG